jgi:beta-aspartyl-peptidase (threonine type)
MYKLLLILFLFIMNYVKGQNSKTNSNRVVLVIHGGAGTILKKNLTPEKEKEYELALQQALLEGYAILNKGRSALDAVETVVKMLEDNPLFNAGRGSVFTNEGKNELDASIMDGKTLAAGAVAGVTNIKNPISAARVVMEKSGHVMMVGKGAEKFAAMHGLELVDQKYFYTEDRWKSFLRVRSTDPDSVELDHGNKTSNVLPVNIDSKFGTVGAVALDIYGNLAAATSTGGMTNKKYGRVGDSPIIGAGTYADNNTCAVSCTGWGEYFIRLVVAKTVCDLMAFKKITLEEAAYEVIKKKLQDLGGDGGLIAVDKDGNISMPFNTEGMYRGYIKSDGKAVVKIYGD